MLDGALLLCCCVLVAGRCQINEVFPTGWRVSGPPGQGYFGQGSTPAMLLFAGVICTAALLWLLPRLWGGPIQWRRTGLLAALLIMATAAAVSVSYASNRYTATVGALNLLSQIVLAVLLVQLLDTPWKRRLLLCVVVAAGVTLAYRCWEQHTYEIADFQATVAADPEQALQMQGIEPGSYAAGQFLNRVASGDVAGFFTVSNMAGSVFVLTIMISVGISAAVLRRPAASGGLATALILAAAAIQVYGLMLTRSRGAILALVASVLGFLVLWIGRRFFVRHWRGLFASALLLIVVAVAAVVLCGLRHDRLPTLSLWVRWQYWTATAAMIAEHWLTGVGPENFGTYYLHYMNAGAGEAVKDPHCMWLALWSQWGLLGLIGAVWAAVAIALHLARPVGDDGITGTSPRQDLDKKFQWLWPIAIITATVLIRRATSDMHDVGAATRASVYLIAFLMPAVVWLLAFSATLAATRNRQIIERSSPVLLALAAGLMGFLLHNTIDLAIFQPGVGTLFFACVALAVASRRGDMSPSAGRVMKSRANRIIIAGVSIVLVTGLHLIVWLGVASHRRMERAQAAALNGRYDKAKESVRSSLNPEEDFLAGRIEFMQWQSSPQKTADSLRPVTSRMSWAWGSDRANYRYPLELSRVYDEAANHFEFTYYQKNCLAMALESAKAALERHPKKSELLIEYADLLGRAGDDAEALAQYQAAIASERAYVAQQRAMHGPGATIRPRLPRQIQQHAQARIERLEKQVAE